MYEHHHHPGRKGGASTLALWPPCEDLRRAHEGHEVEAQRVRSPAGRGQDGRRMKSTLFFSSKLSPRSDWWLAAPSHVRYVLCGGHWEQVQTMERRLIYCLVLVWKGFQFGDSHTSPKTGKGFHQSLTQNLLRRC